MRVDHEKREIVCSVGDLVYPTTYRRIGVERGDGFRRMWLGQDIHSRRAEVRAAEGGGMPRVQGEWPVEGARRQGRPS